MSFEPILLDGVQQFSLHPNGIHGVGGKNDDKPIASLQRSPDFVVPLLGTADVIVCIPHRNSMAPQNTDLPLDKGLAFVRMRDE